MKLAYRISKEGQITVPLQLLNLVGLCPDDEVDITATKRGLEIRKVPTEQDPIERVFGIWGNGGSTDDYIKFIRPD